ncbi:uncharacterized protein MONBRDRAFT_30207 [Monosiga brevicollis MX1]|uniref:DNA 3'-5' helicase n=1 Tax=Monosiga brevicollis TaxID=81824 RepID=A9VDB1_MONBE|nr:uncharacterized protein MONBRDRAFT_30207 [Monosiga brevicollis MX1]EDQ84497.1 predicted protein [Monosiga brevicollis MX1]|eukprot:XP_001750684.1 hypothetical protein [Monosiga brevicollis MX1]
MLRWSPHDLSCEIDRLEAKSDRSKTEHRTLAQYRSTLPFYERYKEHCQRQNWLDFDDQLLNCDKYLEQNSQIKPFKHVLVDEFQDTNLIQYTMARRLAADGNLFVVGDPNQAIYSWCGAQPNIFVRIQKDYASNVQQIELRKNYRSTKAILKFSSTLICQQQLSSDASQSDSQGTKQATQEQGPDVCLTTYPSLQEELSGIVQIFSQTANRAKTSLRYSDFAILLRTNATLCNVEQELKIHHLPYRLAGKTGPFQSQEVGDLLAYLRLINDRSDDDDAFKRICNRPSRGIGVQTLNKLDNLAKEQKTSLFSAAATSQLKPAKSFADLIAELRGRLGNFKELSEYIQMVIKEIKFEEHVKKTCKAAKTDDEHGENDFTRRWKNVELLIDCATSTQQQQCQQHGAKASDDVERSIQDLLINFVERYSDGITVSTVHKAKGLEWAVVAVPDVNDHNYPHINTQHDGDDAGVDEERRLLYQTTLLGLDLPTPHEVDSEAGSTCSRNNGASTPGREQIMRSTSAIVPRSEVAQSAEVEQTHAAPQDQQGHDESTQSPEPRLRQASIKLTARSVTYGLGDRNRAKTPGLQDKKQGSKPKNMPKKQPGKAKRRRRQQEHNLQPTQTLLDGFVSRGPRSRQGAKTLLAAVCQPTQVNLDLSAQQGTCKQEGDGEPIPKRKPAL